MLKLPRFKPHLRIEVVPGEGAFVLSGNQQTLLKGRLYEQVAPWVGDGRTVDDLCDQLREHMSPAEVYFVLGQLEKKGYLCEGKSEADSAEDAFWTAQQIDTAEAASRLADTPIALTAFGADPAPFADLLSALHVRVEGRGALGVVVTNDYLSDALETYNRDALASGMPWLLVRPTGRELWVGPLFRPGLTACWECLAQRLRANSPVESYLSTRHGRRPSVGAAGASSSATRAVADGLAANAVATWVARGGDLPVLEGKIQSFDIPTWASKAHSVVRLPFCPACGSGHAATDGAHRPIALKPHDMRFSRDGGYRVVTPEVTLERYGQHVSPLTGAVSMLERVGAANDSTIHVYIAGHNLARRHLSLEHLRGDLRNMSSGKGATDIQAKASGLCEGLERYSGVFRGDEARRLARFDELGEMAIHPNQCLRISDRQYRERDAWNARKSHFNYVPVPFDPSRAIEWTPVWSLTRQESRYLPTSFCYFNYPHPEGPPFCVACSNGNAAGNTLEEAILQGFLELVERDNVALWWYSRVQRPGVDLDRFDDGYLSRLRDVLAERGRMLWALDLTCDWGIPVYAALSCQPGGPEERIVLGFGAHLDARIALLRAVTEMNQMLSNLPGEDASISGKNVTDAETLAWLQTATRANQPYLEPLPERVGPVALNGSFGDCTDLAGDVKACQALVERQGLEMLVLDQTRPEIGLPVAKVIVPGMRHFWARFAPGRLYEVPVKLGWLARPLAEEELNPIPMFL